jgi:hypothetical protein
MWCAYVEVASCSFLYRRVQSRYYVVGAAAHIGIFLDPIYDEVVALVRVWYFTDHRFVFVVFVSFVFFVYKMFPFLYSCFPDRRVSLRMAVWAEGLQSQLNIVPVHCARDRRRRHFCFHVTTFSCQDVFC